MRDRLPGDQQRDLPEPGEHHRSGEHRGPPQSVCRRAKEKGEPTKKEDYLTDAQLKEKGKNDVMPDASYADEYAKYYAYNMKDIDQAEKDWKDFIDTVVGLIEKNGKANVVIEASASNVPTKTPDEREPEQQADGGRPCAIDRGREGTGQEPGPDPTRGRELIGTRTGLSG